MFSRMGIEAGAAEGVAGFEDDGAPKGPSWRARKPREARLPGASGRLGDAASSIEARGKR
jgi:hypothetical protein